MKNLKTIMLLVAVMSVGILFTSCNEEVQPEGNWTLISIENDNLSFSVEEGNLDETVSMFLSLKEDGTYSISGFSGVNSFSGNATLEKNEITVSPLGVTMMMGTPESQNIEDAFLAAVQAGGKLSADEEDGEMILVVKTENDAELKFKKTILENTTWDLVMYNVGNAVTNLPSVVSNVNIGFANDNSIFGNTGTNQIMGSFEYTKEGSLTLGAMGMTRMAAMNEEAYQFEVRLMELYSQVTKYSINGSSLTLSNDAGETLLVFEK